MKTKKVTIFSLTLATALSFNSCKKGKEDPFLSFRSRDARITGTWELKSIEYSKTVTTNTITTNNVNTDKTTSNDVVTTTRSFDGTTWTETIKQTTNTTDDSKTYDWTSQTYKSKTDNIEFTETKITTKQYSVKVTLYKDNTYTAEYSETEISYSDDQTTTVNGSGTTSKKDTTYSPTSPHTWTEEGTWTWLDSKKNKIYILAGPLWGRLLRLSNKELIIDDFANTTDDNTTNNQGNFDTYDNNNPFTFKQGIETTVSNSTTSYTKQETWEKTDKKAKR